MSEDGGRKYEPWELNEIYKDQDEDMALGCFIIIIILVSIIVGILIGRRIIW